MPTNTQNTKKQATTLIKMAVVIATLFFTQAAFAEVTGGYPFVTSSTSFRLAQGNKCWGFLAGEKDCGYPDIDFVNDFFKVNTLAYGSSGQVKTASNNPEFPAYGYAHAFFLTNASGQEQPLDITFGSCNDVAIYTTSGRVKSASLGTETTLVYHRFPGNEDGGGSCPCDDVVKPNIMIPKGNFRLVVLTRGSKCSSYLSFPTDKDNQPVNWMAQYVF